MTKFDVDKYLELNLVCKHLMKSNFESYCCGKSFVAIGLLLIENFNTRVERYL